MKKDLLFIGLENPELTRKTLLTCSKNLFGVLKAQRELNETRKEKLETIQDFKKCLDELTNMNKKLKTKMPVFKKVKPKKSSRINEIEEEINRISERLKTLNI